MLVDPGACSPRAALALTAVHATLHGHAAVEGVVKKALRQGSREGLLPSAAERAALASAVFGTSVLRSRLSYVLAHAIRTSPKHVIPGRGLDRWTASASLLAIWLLHEEPQRCEPAALLDALPPASLGLPASWLHALASLDVERNVCCKVSILGPLEGCCLPYPLSSPMRSRAAPAGRLACGSRPSRGVAVVLADGPRSPLGG